MTIEQKQKDNIENLEKKVVEKNDNDIEDISNDEEDSDSNYRDYITDDDLNYISLINPDKKPSDEDLSFLTFKQENNLIDIMKNNLNGVEAMPYQFLQSVDNRINGTKIGRKYAEKIMNRMPLLFLTPCRPKALADFSKKDKDNIIQMLVDNSLDEELISGTGKYYSTTFAYEEYYRYLNCMLSAVSAFLNIYDEKIIINGNKSSIGTFNWTKELNSSFKTFFSSAENIVFYLNEFNSISENFSNSTRESSIASQINGTSDEVNEIKFLLGENSGFLSRLANNTSKAVSSISSALSDIVGAVGGGIVGSLADEGINTIANGGKIIFPEIWSNSEYSRSYSLDIKLRSPDHDKLSIYLNILKPYCKILALCLPRVMESEELYDVNGYQSPFLVKAFSKGKFNIDMGMITGLSVNKGAECQWNDDGLPTQIDITLDIAELYSVLAMSGFDNNLIRFDKNIKRTMQIVNNTAYMDFLANMAGLNVGTMDVGKRIRMFFYLTKANLSLAPSMKYTEFEQIVSRIIGKAYEIF